MTIHDPAVPALSVWVALESPTHHVPGVNGMMDLVAKEVEGLPIPPEQLERLFDRFYRGDAARGRPAGSSGLGLAIVKAIMALHGGTARASCSAAGTIRFELRFPAQPAASPGR